MTTRLTKTAADTFVGEHDGSLALEADVADFGINSNLSINSVPG